MSEVVSLGAPRWGAAGWALVLAAFALGFSAFPLKTIGPTADHLPGDTADNRLNNFILEHGYRYLRGDEPSFWDAPMLHPLAGATHTSDAHLGMLPMYALFRAAGLSPESAFQGYFLVPFVLNFAAAAWAVRRLGFGPTAAAVCAYLFTFSLPLAAQLQHVQLFPRFLVPPAVVVGWEHLRAPRPWRAWAVVGCVVGQTYLTAYIGALLLLLLAAGFTVTAVRFRRERPWREVVRPGWRTWAAAAAGALALAPLLSAHARAAGGTPRAALRELALRPGAWVTPPAHAATFPELADATGLGTWEVGEQQLLPGLLTLAALPVGLAVAVRRNRSPDGRSDAAAVAGLTALGVVLFVTRYGPVWPYELLTHLPGVGGVRAVGRVVLVLLFPLGVVLGACAEGLVAAAARHGRFPAAAVGLLALGAVAADHWLVSTTGPHERWWGLMRSPKEVTLRRQAAIAAAIRAHPAPKVLYVFPSFGWDCGDGAFGVQCEAMRAAQDAGVVCVNGWTGYLPPGWDFFHGYRGLVRWLTVTGVSDEEIAGLVLVGEPIPDADPVYEAAMRAAFPPHRPAVAP